MATTSRRINDDEREVLATALNDLLSSLADDLTGLSGSVAAVVEREQERVSALLDDLDTAAHISIVHEVSDDSSEESFPAYDSEGDVVEESEAE